MGRLGRWILVKHSKGKYVRYERIGFPHIFVTVEPDERKAFKVFAVNNKTGVWKVLGRSYDFNFAVGIAEEWMQTHSIVRRRPQWREKWTTQL